MRRRNGGYDAEATLRAEADPASGQLFDQARGTLELARGRYGDALAAFRAAGKHAELLVTPDPVPVHLRALELHALLLAGDSEPAEKVLAGMGEQQREAGEICGVVAALRLAQGDPRAALEALATVLDGSAPAITPARVGAYLLAAMALDAAGDPAAAQDALERALDLAARTVVMLFLVHRAPELLERHARRRTAHAALAAEVRALLAPGGPDATAPAPGGTGLPQGRSGGWAPPEQRWSGGTVPPEAALLEPVSEMEMRVLRFLPTNLKAAEIAGELYLSVHTVKTHIRHLYTKLGAHGRGEAVRRARALGLLAPTPRGPDGAVSSRQVMWRSGQRVFHHIRAMQLTAPADTMR